MFWSLQDSYVEILMPHVMVLESGAFGRCLSSEGDALMNRISAFIKEAPQSSPVPCCHVRAQQEVWTQKVHSPGHAGTLILHFPASRTVRNKFL